MSLAGGRGSGSVRLISPPACPVAVPVDTAIEYLMVKKDFQAALDTCEKGLESLASAEQEESWWVRLTAKSKSALLSIQTSSMIKYVIYGQCIDHTKPT